MYKFIENGSVTSAVGFYAAGIFAGIKKKRKDLALIYSKLPCNAAGTFTLNKVKAAPLVLSKQVISEGHKIKAVLVNSGNANACTGDPGYEDALITQKYCADKLNLLQNEVLLSSTGVIGQRLPVTKVLMGIEQIIPELSENGGLDAAEAIMTTDTKRKAYAVSVELEKAAITIGGICKGSGMIMPNMATMLGFITTDADIEQNLLQSILLEVVNVTFNKISVDGETSTNDMVVLLANGASGIKIEKETTDAEKFKEGLKAVCTEMAKSIASDGEGATKLITINITGADTQVDADLAGKCIANSPLVKTAVYGRDANWGRIMSSVGMSGAEINPNKVSISFDEVPILLPGFNIVVDEKKATEVLSKSEVNINVNLNGGKFKSTWWSCDFTENYIKINADYRS
ncbi:MAG: bifunctional glutamate N-acetyltransferase/amino-acid acetyltransferase ArgJ [bacterium]